MAIPSGIPTIMKKTTMLLTVLAISALSGCISVKKDTVAPASTTTTVTPVATVQHTTTTY